jgi:PBP1b-binding outer membrane lipoprotein LpoB
MRKRKTKMKNLATIVAAALILSSSVQLAAAASNHHQAKTHQTAVHQQRNNLDAYASWPAGRVDVYEPGPSYSGGYSAPAGR